MKKTNLYSRLSFAIILIIIASLLIDVILIESIGHLPYWFLYAKLGALIFTSLFCFLIKDLRQLLKYNLTLIVIILSQVLIGYIGNTPYWISIFPNTTFIGNFGGSILLKAIEIIPIIIILLMLFKSPKEYYLCVGDLSVKADAIPWLGIKKDSISWGKLALVSAICISLGTLLLTLLTVPNLNLKGLLWLKWLKYLPIIIPFAIVNSFCEGVVFRTTILGTLKNVLPKSYVILIGAGFYGIAHYYGAPSGPLGVLMSGLLGWYMCRSMYETKGFLSSWIIHAFQDFVIFSTICLMGSFI